MEISLITSAVTAASVDVQATVSPPLPVNYRVSQLLESDIQLRATVAPSLAMQTYAFMGVNTALIQAAVMTKAKVYTAVPAQIKARIDIVKGNLKVEFLSLQGINTIASAHAETVAIARNVEDLPAARSTPLISSET
ncbi:open beta-sheet domain-containing protein, partial [Acinetobacter baumannii]